MCKWRDAYVGVLNCFCWFVFYSPHLAN